MNFVSKNLAIKLKEKGFDKPCFGWYYVETPTGMTDGELVLNRYPCRSGTYKETLEMHIDFQPKEGFVGYINPNVVDAPTIEQVLEWLRDEKKLHIEPCVLADSAISADGNVISVYTYWSFCVTSTRTGYKIYFEYGHIDDKRFDSYEQATIAGIEYVINNLI